MRIAETLLQFQRYVEALQGINQACSSGGLSSAVRIELVKKVQQDIVEQVIEDARDYLDPLLFLPDLETQYLLCGDCLPPFEDFRRDQQEEALDVDGNKVHPNDVKAATFNFKGAVVRGFGVMTGQRLSSDMIHILYTVSGVETDFRYYPIPDTPKEWDQLHLRIQLSKPGGEV